MHAPRLGKGSLDLLIGRYVDLAEYPADFCRDLLATRGVAVEDRNLGPSSREFPRRRLTEPRCCAGHDGCDSIDVHFISRRSKLPLSRRLCAQRGVTQDWWFSANPAWMTQKASLDWHPQYRQGIRSEVLEGT